jgi:acyl-CoA thioester hydrolase
MTTVRVLYADTDLAGVVYHANYLRYFEAARTDLLYGLGFDIARAQERDGILFTITEASLQYLRPALYGDVLTVEVFPTKLGPARLVLGYKVRRNDESDPCVTGQTTVAAIDRLTGRVVRLPRPMRDSLAEALAATP